MGEKTAQIERDDDVFTRGCRGTTKRRFENEDDSEDDDEKKRCDAYNHEK